MLRFLRDNWLWIVLPFALVAAAMLLVLALTGGSEPVPDFTYNVP